MILVALLFSFLRPYQSIEERYLSIKYICKLEYYYVLQVYWEFTEFGLVNRRQSAKSILRVG
jgi:hypothetical protein